MPDVAPLQIELFPSQDRPDMSYPTKKGNPPALKAANGSDILEAKSPEFVNFNRWPANVQDTALSNDFLPDWYQSTTFADQTTGKTRTATLPFASPGFVANISGIGTFNYTDMPCDFIKEQPGSGEVIFGEDVYGTRIFEVPWELQEKYAGALLGGYSGISDKVPVIFLPDIFSSAFPFLFCQEVKITPIDTLNRGLDQDYPRRIQYERAKLTCTYRPLEHETSIQTAGQIFTLKGSQWHWAGTSLADIASGKYVQGDAVVSEQAFSKVIANGEFSLTKRMFYPGMMPSLMALLGCCNSAPFLGFGTGTLQLVSLEGKTSYLPNNMPLWRVHMKFLFNPQTHLALVNQSGTSLTKSANKIAAKLRNSAQIGKDTLSKLDTSAINGGTGALTPIQNALSSASVADFADGTPQAQAVNALLGANAFLSQAAGLIGALGPKPGAKIQSIIKNATALRGVDDKIADQVDGIYNDVSRLSQTKVQKINPGYQFVRLTSSVAGIKSNSGDDVLVDFDGKTINGSGDMGAKIKDHGLIHRVADFNVLLNYL